MIEIPKWLLRREGMTARQWKAQKRADFKNVIRAMEDFKSGCAYCPGYKEVETVEKLLAGISEALSAKKWGR